MRYFLLILPVVIAGCAATPQAPREPIIETVEILTPVPVSCVPDTFEGPPEYSDTDDALRAAPDGPERFRLVILGRGERESRLSEVETVLENCRSVSYDR